MVGKDEFILAPQHVGEVGVESIEFEQIGNHCLLGDVGVRPQLRIPEVDHADTRVGMSGDHVLDRVIAITYLLMALKIVIVIQVVRRRVSRLYKSPLLALQSVCQLPPFVEGDLSVKATGRAQQGGRNGAIVGDKGQPARPAPGAQVK